jgi:segregation and condensation protein B
MDVKGIIESLLFVSKEPLSEERLVSLLPEIGQSLVRTGINDLVEEYESRQGGFHLVKVAGGYQFRTRPEHKTWVRRLNQASPLRLSRAALEALTIVAYKQPVIRSDIEHIRGVDSGGVIRSLLDLKLIRVLGRKDIPGRPLIYATTKYFLELFGLTDIKDLPTLKEIDALEQKLPRPDDAVHSPTKDVNENDENA